MKGTQVDQATLDSYVLGELSREEELDIEKMAAVDPGLRARIDGTREAMSGMAMVGRVTPPQNLRQKVLSAMHEAVHAERVSGRPPIMHHGSSLDEFAQWLEDPLHVLPADNEGFHLVELDISEDRQTGLVWLKHGSPAEVHSDCVERLMIVEGTCIVHLGKEQVSLSSGDVFTIPMHVEHSVQVTSDGWCKAIVQRVAA